MVRNPFGQLIANASGSFEVARYRAYAESVCRAPARAAIASAPINPTRSVTSDEGDWARAHVRASAHTGPLTAPGSSSTPKTPPRGPSARAAVVDPAVAHAHDAVGGGSHVVVVGHHHDRLTAIVQPTEQPEYLGATLRVERPGRLVGQQQRRFVGEGTGDREALALAAREHARGSCAPCRRCPSRSSRSIARVSACLRLRPATTMGSDDVLQHAHALEQVEELEDEPDVAPAHHGELVVGRPVDRTRRRWRSVRRSGVSRPAIRFSNVDFPQPDGPITATNSPRRRPCRAPAAHGRAPVRHRWRRTSSGGLRPEGLAVGSSMGATVPGGAACAPGNTTIRGGGATRDAGGRRGASL